MASNSGGLGGSGGGHYSIVIESHELSVDSTNNRSLIEVTIYIHYTGGFSAFNNFGSGGNAPSWSASGSGFGGAGGNFTYNFSNSASDLIFINGNQYWIGHDSNGDASVSFAASVNMNNSPSLTTGSTSLSYALTHIPRFAAFTTYAVTNVTDMGFTIQIAADNYCSNIEYSIDNGSTWTSLGAGTAANATLANLPSGTTYNIFARLTRADSGLQTTSGLANATTLLQNSFIGLL